MLRRFLYTGILACGSLGAVAQQPPALTVKIHTEDARATLLALEDPALTHERAIKIAAMYGNQAALRKLHEFNIDSTTEDFADALYAAAHGQSVTTRTQKALLFSIVQPKVKQLLTLLDQIESDPANFQKLIEQRIATFTPPGANLRLQGYVLAAGDGGGYAFGDTNFFLNIGLVDDLVLAQSVTTHEMYHAVQGAFAASRKTDFSSATPAAQEACRNLDQLFANLYEEGTATYVADPSLIPKSHSESAARMLADLNAGLEDIHGSATLLEMSVLSLSAPNPIPYDKVYGIGFFGHAVLYSIAYVMSKDIADAEGAQGITQALEQPPYKFVLRYASLPAYGKDKGHPALGPNTLDAARRLANGCR